MTVLLDTNILIDHLKGRAEATNLLISLAGKPVISVCTIAELYAGAQNRLDEQRIEQLAASLSVLPVTTAIARAASQHIKHYHASHGLDDFDALIAATAEHHDLKLATRNVKHFPMFKRLKAAY